jgi:hypothetical protein
MNVGMLGRMKALTRLSLLLCAALPLTAFSESPPATDPKKPASGAKSKTKAPDISIPTFGEIPKGEGMTAPKSTDLGMETKGGPSGQSPAYTVLKVNNGRGEIQISGTPPTTEKFSTVVRVKCPQKANAPIELVILDPRGDTVMSSSGELNFRRVKGDEVDYAVDWSPTPWPRGGTFSMLVRIGGQPMGTYPLKVAGPNG